MRWARTLLLAALVLAVVALLRRRAAARRERVDVYYQDGSMVSLDGGEPQAERLLGLARAALRLARS